MNDLIETLEKHGIKKAVKALDVYSYKFYCLFLADVAESVLHIFEAKYPCDRQPRDCVGGVRFYRKKRITKEDLSNLRSAALASTRHARHAAYMNKAPFLAAYTVSSASSAPCDAIDVICAAVEAEAEAGAKKREQKWQEIEKLFIKHFGEKQMKKTNEVTITLHIQDIGVNIGVLLDDAQMCIEQDIRTGRLERGGDTISWKTKEVEEEA